MEVTEVDANTDLTVRDLMEKSLTEDKVLGDYFLYNINFKVNGQTVEPGKEVKITFERSNFKIEDTKKANVIYYNPANSVAGNTAAEIIEITQRSEVIEALQSQGMSIDKVDDYDMSEISLNADGTAKQIVTEGRRSTVYGCFMVEDKPVEPTTPAENENNEVTVTPDADPVDEASVMSLDYEDNDVKIVVSADAEGIIPAKAELKVVPVLPEDKDTKKLYEQVKTKLEQKAKGEEYDIAGFLAYDITFVDKDGEKIEPNGEVKVSIEYKKKVIPEGVEVSQEKNLDVTVMHLEENEAGEVKDVVDMVADDTKAAAVEMNDEAKVEKAECITDSFSTFAVTWTSTDNETDAIAAYSAGDNTRASEPTPSVAKTATQTSAENNKYDIQLDISGTVATQAVTSKLDVLLIMDTSGSMAWDDDGNEIPWYSSKTSRLTNAKNAATTFVNNLSGHTNLDVQYAMVTFSATASAKDFAYKGTDYWVDAATVKGSSGIGGLNNANGATNYQDAFAKAKTVLGNSEVRSDAKQVVVFLTDGEPTYYGSGQGEGDESTWEEINGAKTGLTNLQAVDHFYSIGFGSDFKNTNTTEKQGSRILRILTEGGTLTGFKKNDQNDSTNIDCNGANLKSGVSTDNRKMYSAAKTADLNTVFNNIANQITEIACENVVVKDTLSNNIETTTDTKYQLKITRKAESGVGTVVYQSPATAWGTAYTLNNPSGTSDYNATTDKSLNLSGLNGTKLTFNGKTITCTYPTAYKLGQNYTYSIVITDVKVADATVEDYKANEAYPDTADANTGTHASQRGYYSNVNTDAVMTYKANNVTKSMNFPKPVVQVTLPATPPPGGNLVEPVPTVGKEAILTDVDNVYDINLDVSSSIGSVEHKAMIDVLLIMDRSGSMAYTAAGGNDANDNSLNSAYWSRMKTAKTAATNLVTKLADDQKIDAKFALVSFASSASQNLSWTENKTTVNTTINDLSATGGTNYEAAFTQASEYLTKAGGARSGAQQIVIFLTDGVPTFNGTNTKGGSSEAIKADVEGAKNGLAKLGGMERFYSIGFGNDFSSTQTSSYNGYKILNALTNGGNAPYGEWSYDRWGNATFNYKGTVSCPGANAPKRQLFSATDTTSLYKAFEDIQSQLSEVACTSVAVTDTLSANVETKDNTQYQLKIYRNAAEGQDDVVVYESPLTNWGTPYTLASVEGTTSYNATTDASLKLNGLKGTTLVTNGKTITCTYPASYGLSSAYTYSIEIKNVAVTEEAKASYMASGTYPSTGEANTGTHAGDDGFFSNVNADAKMTYKVNDTDKSVNFPKPVVQVTPENVSHTVVKTWENQTDVLTSVDVALKAYVYDTNAGATEDPETKVVTPLNLTHANYQFLPENMTVTLSSGNNWMNTWNDLPKYYYYTKADNSIGIAEITYTAEEIMTDANKDFYGQVAENGTTTTITNIKKDDEDNPLIEVSKTFNGLTKAQIQALATAGFAVTVENTETHEKFTTSAMSNLGENLKGSDDTKTWTYTWTLDNCEAGTYKITEVHYTVDGYTVSTTVDGFNNGAVIDNWDDVTVTTEASEITYTATVRETSCSKLNYTVGKVNLIVAKLTQSEGYFVWTRDKASINDRLAIVDLINDKSGIGFSPAATMDKCYFYSGDKIGETLTFREGTINYDSESTLTFDASKQWAMFATGNYTVKEGQGAEVAITNTYTPSTVTIDMQKYSVNNDTNQLTGAKFSLFEGKLNGEKIEWANTELEDFKDFEVSSGKTNELVISSGYYMLKETTAPTGFAVLASPIYLKIEAGVVSLIDADGNAKNSDDMWTLSGGNLVYTLKVKNNVAYELPHSGGMGIFWYSIGGVLLMMAAALILYRKKVYEGVLKR
ncbi:MAG: VWA domain-containing protein [Clostridia bacterium]|nr:VWA domain-containing protein [Clostridia bacterium]